MKPKPVSWQYQISYQPILLSWENWQSQIYAGNKLSVVAHVVNDDDYFNDLTGAHLQWWIEKGDEKFLSEISSCHLFLITEHIRSLSQ